MTFELFCCTFSHGQISLVRRWSEGWTQPLPLVSWQIAAEPLLSPWLWSHLLVRRFRKKSCTVPAHCKQIGNKCFIQPSPFSLSFILSQPSSVFYINMLVWLIVFAKLLIQIKYTVLNSAWNGKNNDMLVWGMVWNLPAHSCTSRQEPPLELFDWLSGSIYCRLCWVLDLILVWHARDSKGRSARIGLYPCVCNCVCLCVCVCSSLSSLCNVLTNMRMTLFHFTGHINQSKIYKTLACLVLMFTITLVNIWL